MNEDQSKWSSSISKSWKVNVENLCLKWIKHLEIPNCTIVDYFVAPRDDLRESDVIVLATVVNGMMSLLHIAHLAYPKAGLKSHYPSRNHHASHL